MPALEIHVEPAPELVAEIPLPPEEAVAEEAASASPRRVSLVDILRRWGLPTGAVLLVALLAARLWRTLRPVLAGRLAEIRRRRAESDSAAFARFRRAALAGDARATWNEWTVWLDRRHRGPGAATIRSFVSSADDADLELEYENLAANLFGRGEGNRTGWSGRSLVRSVVRVRRKMAARHRPHADMLAPLNPDGELLP